MKILEPTRNFLTAQSVDQLRTYHLHRCSSILCRNCYGKFGGRIRLENWNPYQVNVCVEFDCKSGADCLRIVFRPALCKTPIDSDPPIARRYHGTLHRQLKQCSDVSDFKGEVIIEGRMYTAGVYVAGEERLRLYLRPEFSKTPGAPSALEVFQ